MKKNILVKIGLLYFCLTFSLFTFITTVQAGEWSLGTFEGLSPFQPKIEAGEDSLSSASNIFAQILSNVIGFLTLIGGLFFLIYFMIGGLNWIMAGGKPENIQKAQDTMTNAVIGLIIMVAAYSIAFIVSQVLGIDFLNIGEVISKLGPGS